MISFPMTLNVAVSVNSLDELQKLVDSIGQGNGLTARPVQAMATPKPKVVKQTDAPTEAPTPAPTEAATEAPTAAPTPAPTEAPTTELTYQDVCNPFLELFNSKGKQVALDVLTKHNCKSLKDAPKDLWPAIKADVEAALND